MQKCKRPAIGFTLLEVLIVLAIIVILAAILFPVMSRVRENSRRTTCQSNQKQLALALDMYLQDYDGKYMSGVSLPTDLAPYTKNQQIFYCPDVDATVSTNAYILALPSFAESKISTPSKTLLLFDSTPLDLRGNSASIVFSPPCTTTVFGVPVGATGGIFTGPVVHFGGGNYLFADGHVKWLSLDGAYEATCYAGIHY